MAFFSARRAFSRIYCPNGYRFLLKLLCEEPVEKQRAWLLGNFPELPSDHLLNADSPVYTTYLPYRSGFNGLAAMNRKANRLVETNSPQIPSIQRQARLSQPE
jgi:hypothetical protein